MKRIFIVAILSLISACSSDEQESTPGTSSANVSVSQSDILGEWQYAGNYGDNPDARIPGFLKEHGYIISSDGSWKSRNKQYNGEYFTGSYTLEDDLLAMTGKSIAGSGKTTIKIENGYLIMLSDISIRGGDDKPAQTRYTKM